MRKLIMKTSISLDGFVSDSNGQKDWVFNTGDEKSLAWSVEKIREAELIVMGRKSLETMAPYWPTGIGPFAAPMNNIPKALFTKKGFKGIDPVAYDNCGTVTLHGFLGSVAGFRWRSC